jgi:hypothetical protein
MRLVIDCETNAIDFAAWNRGDTSSLKTVHCLCAIDADTGEEFSYEGDSVSAGLFLVYSADTLIGHNLKFDIRVLETISKVKLPHRIKTVCTYGNVKKMFPNGFREHLITNPDRKGSNSLEAWGQRLGVFKQKYPTDWSKFDPLMAAYCMQDCRVTLALHRLIERRKRWGFLAPLVETFIR